MPAADVEHGVVGVVIAVVVRDRNAKNIAGLVGARERGSGLFDADMNIATDISEGRIAHKDPRQQPGLA